MAIVLGNYLSLPTTEGPKATAPPLPGFLAFVGALNGRLYKTNDFQSFTELQPAGNIDRQWRYVVTNRINPGTDIIAVSSNGGGGAGAGGVYRTLNGGSTWSIIKPTAQFNPVKVVASDDMQYLYAAHGQDGSGRFWRSNDGGATWTQSVPTAGNLYGLLWCDPTGQYVWLIAGNSFRVWFSSNYGATFALFDSSSTLNYGAGVVNIASITKDVYYTYWGPILGEYALINAQNYGSSFQREETQGFESNYFNLGDITANKSVQILALGITSFPPYALQAAGKFIVNKNNSNPANWVEKYPTGAPGNIDYKSVCLDKNSGQIGIIGTNQRLYMTNDFFESFQEIQPAGNVNAVWTCAAIYNL